MAYYDDGGQGVAYNDNDATNDFTTVSGTTPMRTDQGVDVCTSSAPYISCLGFTNVGEWINYTVNVTTSGTYNITANYATDAVSNSMRAIDFSWNNSLIPFAAVSLGTTGAWSTILQASTSNIHITSGTQILTVTIAGYNDFNILGLQFDLVTPDEINELNNDAKTFTLATNPDGSIRLNISSTLMNGQSQIILRDITGKEISSQKVTIENEIVSTNNLSSGVYLISVKNNSTQVTKKIVIK